MKNTRIASIDILRALTMVLMIWVNDFWTLTGIPKWLKHANAIEDYLGFSDIIFPLFLFIVGLSIPLAIQQRKKKGEPNFTIAKHIIIRSISLLIIGFFMVNYETLNHNLVVGGKYVWGLLMATAVVLIWMNWNKSPVPKKWHNLFIIVGISILILLAVIYKSGPDGTQWMTKQWWGILGLIGWAYLLNALVFLYAKGNLYIMIGLLIILNVLCVFNHTDILPKSDGYISYLSVLYTGATPAFTAAGIVTSLIFSKLSIHNSKRILPIVISLGIISLIYGIATKSFWGISKIQATPSWLAICTGISFISFAVFYYIADIKKQTKWSNFIAPAGTATLSCYMVPYFIYPLREMNTIRLPSSLNEGIVGLLGSFIFSLVVVTFIGWTRKKGFTLKL